jgi:glycerol-3-phosphate dehydrogenase (NAD(P)+)
MVRRVAVLGAGSWGTTVATLASQNAPTVLWARSAELAEEINSRNTNERYLPGFSLPPDLLATPSVAEAVRDADVVVVGVPSHGFRALLEELKSSIPPAIPVLSPQPPVS